MSEEELEEIYKKAKEERDKYTNDIIKSISSGCSKVIIAAGPGTGKTFLFGEVLETLKEAGKGNVITLTFINSLVNDLSLGLFGLSEVRTLHGFSIHLLREKIKANIFPKISEIIEKDASVLIKKGKQDFKAIFQKNKDEEKTLDFYRNRRNYYGNYYSFSDSIFELVKYFENNENEIPKHDQILIDEFQDFNQVEVNLIDLLAKKSPILIVGDDDQSLYDELKNAEIKYIRDKHSDTCPEYRVFPLPFCSRSTRVIVEAVNDIVKNAKKNNLLNGRINKEYRYFPCKDKDEESEKNKKIIYSQKFNPMLGFFIRKQVGEIAKEERKNFSVLIIMPPQLKNTLLSSIVKYLKNQGFRNINYPDVVVDEKQHWFDGLELLLEDEEDNLGWRILAELLLSEDDLVKIIKASKDNSISIKDLLDSDIREEIKNLLDQFRKVSKGVEIEETELIPLLKRLGCDTRQILNKEIERESPEKASFFSGDIRGIRDIPITITTIPGSKGLSSDYVFLTNFDDNYYIKDVKKGISDKDIFKFLVALTRARKKVFLVSSKNQIPKFLSWIDTARIQEI